MPLHFWDTSPFFLCVTIWVTSLGSVCEVAGLEEVPKMVHYASSLIRNPQGAASSYVGDGVEPLVMAEVSSAREPREKFTGSHESMSDQTQQRVGGVGMERRLQIT